MELKKYDFTCIIRLRLNIIPRSIKIYTTAWTYGSEFWWGKSWTVTTSKIKTAMGGYGSSEVNRFFSNVDLQDLEFSHWYCWRFKSSGMLCCVIGHAVPGICLLHERITSPKTWTFIVYLDSNDITAQQRCTLMQSSTAYSLFKLKSIGNLWHRVDYKVNWPGGERGKGSER